MAEVAHILPTIDLTWPFALKLNAFTLAKIDPPEAGHLQDDCEIYRCHMSVALHSQA